MVEDVHRQPQRFESPRLEYTEFSLLETRKGLNCQRNKPFTAEATAVYGCRWTWTVSRYNSNESRSWIYRYRLNGKQEPINIGPYPILGLKDARDSRDALAVRVAGGISPVEEERKVRAESTAKSSRMLTVREFGERYLMEQVDKNWKDPSNERRYIEKDFFPDFGERALKDISVVDIQTVTYRKRDNGHPVSALRLRSALKRMYDYAVEQRLTMINPATMVATKFIGKAVRRKRNLTPRELREFLQVIYRNNIRRQFKLALHIILLTLVRKSMLVLATWNEFDFGAGEWNIPKEHVKAKRGEEHEHVVYMSSKWQRCSLN